MYFRILDNGRLPDGVKEMLSKLIPTYAGQHVEMTLQPAKKRRSLGQNAFFHGPFLESVTHMFNAAGNTLHQPEVKEMLKKRFGLRVPIKMPDGGDDYVPKSTRDYSTSEIEDFMQKIRVWAALYGFELPLPNEFE